MGFRSTCIRTECEIFACPCTYVNAMNDLLKRNGYRFVIDRFRHFESVRAGNETVFVSNWRNIGVAPSYNTRALTYRLRSENRIILLTSSVDIRTWLPGSFEVTDSLTIPSDLAAGSYHLDLALLDRAGTEPTTVPLPPLFLGISGCMADGWYNISEITVIR